MESANFGTATKRQRWALFCLTKKDYREVCISKEEASEMISQYNKGEKRQESHEKSQNKEQKAHKYNEVSSEELREEFTKIWGNNTKMVEHCVKSHSTSIRLSNGKVICFDRPRIETDFWVGYSDCGQGITYEEANNKIDCIRTNIEEYFFKENMDKYTVLLKKCNDKNYRVYTAKQYDGEEESNFVCFYLLDTEYSGEFERLRRWSKDFQEVTDSEDINLIKWAIQEDANKFKKRLNAYIKRFGTSKLHCSRYWVDR